MATLSDNNVKTRAGSGSIEISHTSIASADSFETESIGSLGLEYDMEEEGNSTTSIFFLPASIKLVLFDQMASGDSLFEALEAVPSGEYIDVVLDFTTDGAWSFTDNIISFTKNDIEYSYDGRKVTIEARYRFSQTPPTIANTFSAYPGDVETLRYTNGSTVDCMAAKDFIENVMATLWSTATVINGSNNFSADPTSGSNTWVVYDGLLTFDPAYKAQDSIQALYRLASTDAAVVGAFMGQIFFVYRGSTASNVALSTDDVDEGSLQIETGIKHYRSISGIFFSSLAGAANENWASPYVILDELNPKAIKDLRIAFHLGELQPASWDAANSRYDDEGGTFVDIFTGVTSAERKEGSTSAQMDEAVALAADELITFTDKYEVYRVERVWASSTQIHFDPPLPRDLAAGVGVFRYDVTAAQQEMAIEAIEAYAKAYGADGSRRITLTIQDVDTLRPHQTFTLDTSFPSFLQGLTFRPSKIDYDLTTDKIKVEAHQI